MKKKICFLLSVVILLLCVSGCTRETTAGLEYSYENAGIGIGNYYAVSGNGVSGKIVIPKIHDGVPVSMVNEFGFDSHEYLNEVVMQEGIVEIGRFAFYACRRLKKVTIPASVSQIREAALSQCPNLTTVIYKGTMERWGQMQRHDRWLYDSVKVKKIVCKDGTITL